MEKAVAHRIRIERKEVALFAIAAVLIAGAFLADGGREPLSSAETRFVEHSASGLQIVPASCPSRPHMVYGEAGDPNFVPYMENCSVPGDGSGGGGESGSGGGTPPSQPPPPSPGNPAPDGWFDGASCDYIYGWSCDASDYNQSVEVHIQEGAGVGNPNAKLWGVFSANYPVGGNPAVCGGTPNHQFRWAVPSALKDGQSHTLYAYALDYPAGGGSFYALSGNPKTIRCSQCAPRYYCSGNDLYYGDTAYSYCSNSFVQACAWGCSGGGCLPPPPPEGNIMATPSVVRSGNTSVITWSAQNVDSCTVTEDNAEINDSWTGANGSKTSGALTQQTIYTLRCTGVDGSQFTDSAKVNIIPVWEEL